ncbi:MAG: methionine synthase [Lentisphaeria bacterium]|nr:methionine synthase [Candidatus Neomarinimicrobiota bacterium]MCF7842787.1 methionine synthase [Lentisphaeria bacterium]
MMDKFLSRLNEKIIVFDGAMGTSIQRLNLEVDDFWGQEGCNELLVLSKPRAIADIHASFLEVGCDVVETDTFGGTRVVLDEYDLSDQVYEINKAAARVARQVVNDFSTPAHPRFVAGSMGPGTKLPTLQHTTYADLKDAYSEQVRGLMDGGVDLLIVETVQDILQAKAALNAIFTTFRQRKVRLPVVVSVTMETTGTMLLGTDMLGALTALEPYPVDVIGLNCATGPKAMSEHVRTLMAHSPKAISVIPNAGLPQNIDGEMVYNLTPPELAHDLGHFVDDMQVNIVGGCCGTTPEHLKAVVEQAGRENPRTREPHFEPAASSLYSVSAFVQEPKPLIIGERTNANGSKKFREFLLQEDWDGLLSIAREQINEGAHMLDVCVAYVGRDESRDMREFVSRLNAQSTIPLMIDSTEVNAIRSALENITGRAIVNSINLEDGEAKAREIIGLCQEFGAGLVCLTIDESGMAKTAAQKLAVARRIYDLAVREMGMRPGDLFFDTLTFTLGSGDGEFRTSAMETLAAIRLIKKELPGVHTSLGVSNVSFGLNPAARHVLNSVFLHLAIEAGLDAAIIHAGKIIPYYKIQPDERTLFEDLIFDRRDSDYDPLSVILEKFADRKSNSLKKEALDESLPVEERLKKRIIDGLKSGLEADLDEALQTHPALEIINTILLDGMKVVGELFGSGEMQLPFVLQSAETMKTAVSHLEPHMEKVEGQSRGKIVLATVKGDVHDIGKNLVDIILTNNGYDVVNLGIKQPIDAILQAYELNEADAIGMSGLLVKSTIVMRENLEVMNERGLVPPVILGGAALTRKYVESDLAGIYAGPVSYAKDAFDGLRLLGDIMAGKVSDQAKPKQRADIQKSKDKTEEPSRFAETLDTVKVPKPPFWGRRVVQGIPLKAIYPYINTSALFRGQWGFKRGKQSAAEFARLESETIEPIFQELQMKAERDRILQPLVLYGYFECQSRGNDLLIYAKPGGPEPAEVLTFPRQQKAPGRCISDYFRSVESGDRDVVAFHLVTVGAEASAYTQELFQSHKYQDYLYWHGFGVETAEGLAEYWHARIRKELGIDHEDSTEIRGLFKQQYHGSRYSFGYPACPDLSHQQVIFRLLQPEEFGLSLTDEFQIVPEQSTSAIIVHHPQAKYFAV